MSDFLGGKEEYTESVQKTTIDKTYIRREQKFITVGGESITVIHDYWPKVPYSGVVKQDNQISSITSKREKEFTKLRRVQEFECVAKTGGIYKIEPSETIDIASISYEDVSAIQNIAIREITVEAEVEIPVLLDKDDNIVKYQNEIKEVIQEPEIVSDVKVPIHDD